MKVYVVVNRVLSSRSEFVDVFSSRPKAEEYCNKYGEYHRDVDMYFLKEHSWGSEWLEIKEWDMK